VSIVNVHLERLLLLGDSGRSLGGRGFAFNLVTLSHRKNLLKLPQVAAGEWNGISSFEFQY
jgi:hypothetical protein